MRRKAGRRDKQIFSKTASRTKDINLGFSARGGIRL